MSPNSNSGIHPGLFEAAWYRIQYPDMRDCADVAGRAARSDVAGYVEQHADEAAGNRDPFAHFWQAAT
jgi:hypothetical protein